MSETGMLFDQEQDSAVWNGLETFSRLPDWLVAAALDPDRSAIGSLISYRNLVRPAPSAKMRC
jgi:hypothetical protein